uniref:J domain-containing protein n=1 Tax=Amazona collaria TaxID=241587 RepID=A0A8B9IW05_9PSIT
MLRCSLPRSNPSANLKALRRQLGWFVSRRTSYVKYQLPLSTVWRCRYHPDKQEADVPAGEVEERMQRFIEIDQAWKILGNEETKKEYDLQQREDNLTKEWPLHAQISLEDMSWNEDDQCYTLSCRCGGNYTVFKSETKDVSLAYQIADVCTEELPLGRPAYFGEMTFGPPPTQAALQTK